MLVVLEDGHECAADREARAVQRMHEAGPLRQDAARSMRREWKSPQLEQELISRSALAREPHFEM